MRTAMTAGSLIEALRKKAPDEVVAFVDLDGEPIPVTRIRPAYLVMDEDGEVYNEFPSESKALAWKDGWLARQGLGKVFVIRKSAVLC